MKQTVAHIIAVVTVLGIGSCSHSIPPPRDLARGGIHRPWDYLDRGRMIETRTVGHKGGDRSGAVVQKSYYLNYRIVPKCGYTPKPLMNPPTFDNVYSRHVRGQRIQLWVATHTNVNGHLDIYPHVLPFFKDDPDGEYQLEYLNPDGSTVPIGTATLDRQTYIPKLPWSEYHRRYGRDRDDGTQRKEGRD